MPKFKVTDKEIKDLEDREKKLGISRPESMKDTRKYLMKLKEDEYKFSKQKDPFVEGEKKYGSKTKMIKESIKELHKLSKKIENKK